MVGGTVDSTVELFDGNSTELSKVYPLNVQKSIGGNYFGIPLICGGLHQNTEIVKQCYKWKNNEWIPSGIFLVRYY